MAKTTYRRTKKSKRKSHKRRSGRKVARRTRGKRDAYCRLGACAKKGKLIFGGPKGMATHKRRHHRG